MCAGPLPALWPLAGLALYARLARRPGGLAGLRLGPGLVLMLGVALPWYGAMTERYGAAFLARMPFFPYATEPRASWTQGLVLAVSFLVVGGFPWSALLPGATAHAATWWRRARPALAGGPAAGTGAAGHDPVSRERREPPPPSRPGGAGGA